MTLSADFFATARHGDKTHPTIYLCPRVGESQFVACVADRCPYDLSECWCGDRGLGRDRQLTPFLSGCLLPITDRAPASGSFGNCRERSLSVEVQQAAEQAALHESVRPKARPRLCSARHSDTTIHSSEKPRPRHAHHSRVKVQAGVRFEFRSSEEEYETSFTSQSVQPKSGAGTDRQPASDTVNTGLL